MLKRLLFVLLLYVIMRNLMYVFNMDLFHVGSLSQLFLINVYGLRFDVSIILLTNILFSALYLIPLGKLYSNILNKIIDILYFAVNSIAIIVNLSDIIYFRFTLKRTTAEFINMFTDDGEMLALIPTVLVDFWYISLIGIIMIYALYRFAKYTSDFTANNNIVYKFSWKFIIPILLVASLTTLGIRGGFQLRPLSIIHAIKYVEHENVPLVLNTTFSLVRTINKKPLHEKSYFSNKELSYIINTEHNYSMKGDYRKLNIVVIIMESMSKEHSAFLNPNLKGKGFTPFLDSLMQHSFVCMQAYANGRKSIEGIPATLASFPTLFNGALISSQYSSNNINSLASLLAKKNYSSSFYHGGNNGTMGFDNFTKSIGFQNYYGRKEYDNDDDYDGKWGIFDHKFFQYFLESLNQKKQPFFASIFSLSAHHPYTLPKGFENKFPKGKLPIQECIAYSDYSLRQFFNNAKQEPWFNTTLFVITADHTSEIADKDYSNSAGKYAIPIVYYMPLDSLVGEYYNTTQQIDIMPSILDYINFDEDFYSFGNSVFSNSEIKESISYNNGVYQYINGNSISSFAGALDSIIDIDKIDNYKILKSPLNKNAEINSEQRIKAIIQKYNYDIIHDRMNVDDE